MPSLPLYNYNLGLLCYIALAKKRLDDCMDTQHGGLSSLFTEKKNCCFITLRFHIFEDKPSESIDKKSYVSREDHPLSLMVGIYVIM